MKKVFLILLIAIFVGCNKTEDNSDNNSGSGKYVYNKEVNTTKPKQVVKLVFIHHSCGENWLADGNGNLGKTLNENNYYVTECYYGWNDHPDSAHYETMGDHTDTEDWQYWFNDVVMPSVYKTKGNNTYTNKIDDPGGENTIIMFKSCFPNSEVGESIEDEKQIYNSLLDYFKKHTDKLFILITPPPMIDIPDAEKTRELTNWLTNYDTGWLSNYEENNVWVFDFYNVLTDPNNHHWVKDNRIEHIVSTSPVDSKHPNELYYDSDGDDHPNAEGNQKSTNEYVPLLNAYYNLWKNNQ